MLVPDLLSRVAAGVALAAALAACAGAPTPPEPETPAREPSEPDALASWPAASPCADAPPPPEDPPARDAVRKDAFAAELEVSPAEIAADQQPAQLLVRNTGTMDLRVGRAYSLACWDGDGWHDLPEGVFFSSAEIVPPGGAGEPIPIWRTESAGPSPGRPPLPPAWYRVARIVSPEVLGMEQQVTLHVHLHVTPPEG